MLLFKPTYNPAILINKALQAAYLPAFTVCNQRIAQLPIIPSVVPPVGHSSSLILEGGAGDLLLETGSLFLLE